MEAGGDDPISSTSGGGGGSRRAKVALGWQNTRPSAEAKKKKKEEEAHIPPHTQQRASGLFLELLHDATGEEPALREDQHEDAAFVQRGRGEGEEDDGGESATREEAAIEPVRRTRRPRSLDDYLHSQEVQERVNAQH